MKINKKLLKLNKYHQRVLTFSLCCAKMTIEYTSIPEFSQLHENLVGRIRVAYFDGQKSLLDPSISDHQDKKQKQKSHRLAFLPAALAAQFNILLIQTFCFLSERFIYFKKSETFHFKEQNFYDRWLLPASRHFGSNRPQQNNFDPLGRRRFNPQSGKGQSRLALLFQGTSRKNCRLGKTDKLFSKLVGRFEKQRELKRCSAVCFDAGLNLLSFFSKIKFQYVLADTKNKLLLLKTLSVGGLILES